MVRNVFELQAVKFALHFDEVYYEDEQFCAAIEALLEELRGLEQDGVRVFRVAEDNAGVIDLELDNEVPLRNVRIWHNRIEKMFAEQLLKQ